MRRGSVCAVVVVAISLILAGGAQADAQPGDVITAANKEKVKGLIPDELRPAVGDRLYGCDDCLTSCPPGNRALEAARPVPGPEILDILGSTDADLLERYGHFYLPARRPRILRRNALIAAGNDRSPELEAVIIGYLGHPDWLLRAHSAWAVGQLGTELGRAALDLALSEERDGRVRRELLGAGQP